MDKTSEFFDAWLKTQEDFTESWIRSTRKIQEAFAGAVVEKEGAPADPFAAWRSAVFSSMTEAGGSSLDAVRETISKAFSSSNAYTRLYEVWLPLAKAIQERSFNPDTYKDLSDSAKYKELLDKVWGFNPDAVAEFNSQTAKLTDLWGRTSGEFGKPWMEAARKNLQAFPQFVEGHPESLINVFHNIFRAFDSTVGTIFHIPAVGKDREKVELILKWLDDLSVYMAKNTEYQHAIYSTGNNAMEKVADALAGKIKEGEEIKSFNDFFNLWIDVNERTYYELFQTDDFSRLQGELLNSSLNVRKHFFKLMELYLFDLPIPLRSEMDDLYKTVYELKKKVRALEKQTRKSSVREEKV